MVDFDLAMLYGVQTKALNQAVKRNIERFPDDFMFQLTKEELDSLRSQFVTSNFARMGLRRPPYAFTRNGIGMLSSVLRSETAVEVNIRIMRAFTAIPEIVNNNVLMMQRILSIEQHQTETDEKVNQILLHYKCLYSDAGGLQIRQNDQSVPIRIRVRYYFCGFCVRMLSWKFANRLF
ncbi:MAG: ORF6N domain-containing protein [Bacteroidaceae bacterium]|nr:ORF6N domain-containing protein [Bacteroidaceae bacterium]